MSYPVSLLRDLAAVADDRLAEAGPEFLVAPSAPQPAAPQQAPAQPEEAADKPRRRHLVLDISIIVGVAVVYVLSLLGYHWLATAPGPLPDPDVSTTDNTVGLVRL